MRRISLIVVTVLVSLALAGCQGSQPATPYSATDSGVKRAELTPAAPPTTTTNQPTLLGKVRDLDGGSDGVWDITYLIYPGGSPLVSLSNRGRSGAWIRIEGGKEGILTPDGVREPLGVITRVQEDEGDPPVVIITTADGKRWLMRRGKEGEGVLFSLTRYRIKR